MLESEEKSWMEGHLTIGVCVGRVSFCAGVSMVRMRCGGGGPAREWERILRSWVTAHVTASEAMLGAQEDSAMSWKTAGVGGRGPRRRRGGCSGGCLGREGIGCNVMDAARASRVEARRGEARTRCGAVRCGEGRDDGGLRRAGGLPYVCCKVQSDDGSTRARHQRPLQHELTSRQATVALCS